MSSQNEMFKTTKQLQNIFHIHLLLMNLHLYNTNEKMMGMLRNEGNTNWTTEQILNLADNNKIQWVQGSDDPEDYDTYCLSMNAALSRILRT